MKTSHWRRSSLYAVNSSYYGNFVSQKLLIVVVQVSWIYLKIVTMLVLMCIMVIVLIENSRKHSESANIT